MKRILSILLVLLLSLTVMTGCGLIPDFGLTNEDLGLPCVHEYEAVVTEPTCTATGITTYTCKLCQDTYTENETAALGHDYASVVTAPTCTAAGYTTLTCKTCGDVQTKDQTSALGHSFANGVCGTCGAADPDYVPTCEHNYKSVVTAPTCTTAGYTTHTCTLCGNSYTDSAVDATGHNYVDGTCTACGATDPNHGVDVPTNYPVVNELKNGDIVIIGAPAYNMALSADKVSEGNYYNKGVDYSAGFGSITDAELFVVTVNSDGSYTFTSKTGVVIALADSYSSLNADGVNKSWEIISKDGAEGIFYIKNIGRPTEYLEWYAANNNWSAYHPSTLDSCYELSFYLVEAGQGGGDGPVEPPVCEHAWDDGVVTNPTCTDGGYTTYTCTLCGNTKTDNAVDALGHSYADGVCGTCGKADPEYVTPGMNKADFGSFEKVDPSLGDTSYIDWTNADGWTLVFGRTDEQTVFGEAQQIILDGSAAKLGILKSALLTGGVKEISFAYGYAFTESNGVSIKINVLDKDGNVVASTDCVDTTLEKGVAASFTWTIETPVEGEFYIQIVNNCPSNAATGNKDRFSIWNLVWANYEGGQGGDGPVEPPVCEHNYDSVVTDPTCDKAGYTTHTCTLCGNSYTDSAVDALGHSYVDGACTVCGAKDPDYVDPNAPTYEVVDPVVGTAYKFGMVQGNLNDGKVYYLDGAMNGYYMNTVTDPAAAIDVYLEATDGGYYMYCYIGGAKTYINMVVNDTHVNGAYEATASTVYTYNTDKQTVIAVVNDADYWFGTRNDKTYTTVGPVKVSYNGFYSQFYAVAGNQGGSGPVEPPVCEHNYESVVTDPTCSTAGYTTHTCSLCGNSYTDSEVEATGNHSYSDATCTTLATCSVCGATTGELADHNYVDGTCTACGRTDGVAENITASKTIADLITELGWTNSTTKQSFNLDDVVSVQINGGSNTGKAYDGDHIRIYATDTPAGTITITLAEGYELVSVKVSAKTGTYAFLCVDGTTTDICNESTAVSGTSVVLNSVKNGSTGKQVRVTAIEVVYVATGSSQPPHEHSYEAVVTDPTCTEAGYTTYTCTCGDSYVADETEALGHSYTNGVCGTCGAEDPNYVPPLAGAGTQDNPYIIPQPGDYVAPFAGGYDLVWYQMTNSRKGGYYTISSSMGVNAWLLIGKDTYNMSGNNEGSGASLTIYLPAGTTCYFAVADWSEAAGNVPFSISFEAASSDPIDSLVGNWKGEAAAGWGSTITYTVEITADGLGTIVENGGYYSDSYNITTVFVNGTTVIIYSSNDYGNLDLTFEYDATANTLTGGNANINVTLSPYDPSDEPIDTPDVNYETVIVLGTNVIYISADELAADLANRQVVIDEDGTYQFSARCLFISKLIAADGTEYTPSTGFYTVPAGEYTAVFTMLSMFGAQADTAYDLELKVPADIGGGDEPGGDDDDEPTHIEPYDSLKDSLYGFYTFDGYEVFLFYNSTVGIYYANVYGAGYDLYFTYEVTEIQEGVYALTLTAAEHESNSGLEYVDIVLGYEIVIGGEIECEHEYEQNTFWHPELVQATCCTPGVAVFECIYCGDYYTEATPVDPEAHAFWGEGEVITPANCATETNGLKVVTCDNGCGATEEQTIYYEYAHEMEVQINVEATCTTAGEYLAVCTLCGYEEHYTSDASGHYNYYMTCGDTGECMACGVEFTLEHSGDEATCTEPMYCYNCSSFVGEPLGHSYVDGTCSVCGEAEHVHNAIFVEAVEAHCHQAGSVAHWYCEGCETAFADEALTETIDDVTVPYTAEIIYVDAVEAACHQNGNVEYWYCSECDAVFTDAELTQLSNRRSVVIPATVGLTHVAAVEAACHQNGCQEYWYCTECEAVFSDAQGIYLTNVRNLTIPYTAEIGHVDALEAACHQNGNVEYWYCTACDAVFTDAALTQLSNRRSVVIPYTAEIVHVEAVAPTCTENGNLEYWYCSECNYLCTDAALTQTSNYKSCIVPATGHNEVVDEAVAPTCTATGLTEGSHCSGCGEVYTAQEVVDALGHADENRDFKCDTCSTKMLPADGEALTIPEALAIANLAGTSYTTQKYYITGIVTNVYNTQYGNMYLKDADGNEICIYGLYTWNGEVRYDAMEYKPVEGDELTVYTVLGMYNTTRQGKNAWIDEVIAHEHDYESVVTEATCLAGGYTTHTCNICNGYYVDSEVEALGHTTEEGTCERCGREIGGDTVTNEVLTADFNTVTSTSSSYSKATTTSGWVATNCAVMGGGTSDSNPKFKVFGDASTRAFTMNGKKTAKGSIVSPTISNGISKISFNYTNCFSESNGVDITITIKQNGEAVASKQLDNNSVTKLTAYEFVWDLAAEGVAVTGDFTIEITNNSPSNSTSNKDRVSIWNLQWTTNY